MHGQTAEIPHVATIFFGGVHSLMLVADSHVGSVG
jgi:hypothetical protein